MKINRSAILMVLITTVLMSLAQILLKYASFILVLDVFAILTNGYLVAGIIIYAAAAVFLILALKRGDLSVIYPMVATSYVWVSMLSPLIFPSDYMNMIKWAGVVIIMIGVTTIGYGGKHG